MFAKRVSAVVTLTFGGPIATGLGGAKVRSEGSPAFVAILRALEVFGFAPFTANHLFGDPVLRMQVDTGN